MKKLWRIIGIVSFWVVWPALYVYLNIGRRTRILILCGDEFLGLKAWLGAGDYGLPGGGLHRGEESVQGALREVREETGLELEVSDLKLLFTKTTRPIRYDAYVVKLSKKPEIKTQKGEIAGYDWLSLKDTTYSLNDDAQTVLARWKNQG